MTIQGLEQTNDYVKITTTTGQVFTYLANDLIAYMDASTAVDPQTDGIAWLKQQIVSDLGEDTIAPGNMDVVFDQNVGFLGFGTHA